MGKIKLLDCTLRDGGYINGWNFGHDNLTGIFGLLAAAGIDMIEIGFLDERVPYDRNRSIMPDTADAGRIYGRTSRGRAMVVGMIDYGTCSLERISPCSESFLDGIRVIFKKDARERAMDFCAGLKQLGYKVFAQLVSVTSYSDGELMDMVRLANKIKPYAVSMVDTYGLMHQDDLMHGFRLLDQGLDAGISLGYHGHNNFQMAYANCTAVISYETERRLFIDGSICGMGKGAGNAPTELVAMRMNRTRGTSFGISKLLEAAERHILPYYQPAAWGYSLLYFLAALNGCHPNYAADLLGKHALSASVVNEILGRLDGGKKLVYDKEYSEQMYRRYSPG